MSKLVLGKERAMVIAQLAVPIFVSGVLNSSAEEAVEMADEILQSAEEMVIKGRAKSAKVK